MDDLLLRKEIQASQEIQHSPVEEQRKKFEHQLQKLQGDKKEYIRQRRLKDKDAENGITLQEETKKVSTGKFSSKMVTERKMVLDNKRMNRNASDKFRRLTKKVLGNGAALDLMNENLSEKAKTLLNSLVTYSKLDVVGAQANQGEKYRETIKDEGKLAFSLTKDMEEFLKTEATKEEKKLLQPHLDRMLVSTRGTLNIGNNPVEDCRGYKSFEKKKIKNNKKKGFFESIKNFFKSKPEEEEEPEEVEKNEELKMESRADQALFPHEPSLNDIAQGSVGDCYFLAALSSVISSDPDAIKNCMKDEGDTVVVRLYHPVGSGDTYHLEPRYYRVDKTVPVDEDGRDLYATGSLWVQMMEKAYTASGINVKNEVKKTEEYQNRDKRILQYDEIETGQAEDAVSYITGKTLDSVDFRDEKALTAANLMNKFFASTDEAVAQREMFKDLTIPEDILKAMKPADLKPFHSFMTTFTTTITNELFLNLYFANVRKIVEKAKEEDDEDDSGVHADALSKTYKEYLTNYKNTPGYSEKAANAAAASMADNSVANVEMYDMTSIVKMNSAALKKIKTIEDFTDYINNATIDTFPFDKQIQKPEDQTRFLNMLKDKVKEKDGVQKIFGERKIFSGEYDNEANRIFNMIREGEQKNMVMTGSSGGFMHNDKSSGLNNEDMDKGLASGHAYSILGVETYDNKKFIRVRNPWGTGTREYQELENKKIGFERKRKDKSSGIFVIELNDFMNHFQRISRGEV